MSDIGNIFGDKVAYGVPSTTNHDRLASVKSNNFPSMKINSVTTSRDILENISANQNAFGFSDIHYYLEYLELGKPVKRHPVGDQVGDEFGIIMPLNNDWDSVMKDFLTEFIKTAKYREMVTRNLGRGALRMIAR
jgi:putative glutamine transport system substrate-binding protein